MNHHHPIEPWTLYAHTQATSNTYTDSFSHVASMSTLEEWAAVWNNCYPHLVGDPLQSVVINGNRISSWSLFRDDIQPKWEHPENENGITLTHRTNVDDINAQHVWRDLVFECIRGAFPDYILGVQVTQKPSRHTTFIKFDVWVASGTEPSHAQHVLLNATNLNFTVSLRTVAHTDDTQRRSRFVRNESAPPQHPSFGIRGARW